MSRSPRGAWIVAWGPNMTVAVSAATDLGLKRARNEDSLAYCCGKGADDSGRGVLLVVADGMGGSRAGEVASELAVHAVVQSYCGTATGDPLENLRLSLEAANRIVHEHSLSHPEFHGMGTTCTAAVLIGRDVLLAHVGDSRAYVLRGGRITQLTHDHSLVAQLVESRQLTPEQARVDPRRNLVTRSVGVGRSVEVDAERYANALDDGDTLMLCTDGLHGLVTDDELAAAGSGPDLDAACQDLIALARARGGHDNITVILARSPARSAAREVDGAPGGAVYLPPRGAAG
jgi:protein phosphatase